MFYLKITRFRTSAFITLLSITSFLSQSDHTLAEDEHGAETTELPGAVANEVSSQDDLVVVNELEDNTSSTQMNPMQIVAPGRLVEHVEPPGHEPTPDVTPPE